MTRTNSSIDLQALLTTAKEQVATHQLQPAYRSFSQLQQALPDNPQIANQLGMIAIQQGQYTVAEQHLMHAIELAPNHSSYWNSLAIALDQSSQHQQAISTYKKAIELDGNNAEAHNNLGNLLRKVGDYQSALASLKQAVAINPNFSQALTNLGSTYKDMQLIDKAILAHQQAIDQSPTFADAHYNLGNALNEAGALDQAYRCYQRTLAIQPEHIGATLGLAMVDLARGKYQEGLKQFEQRLDQTTQLQPPAPSGLARWHGEDLTEKSILITWEQGLGDRIQFVRYVPLLIRRGARVVLQCDDCLRPLMACLHSVELVGIHQTRSRNGEVDFYCPMMSLPYEFGTTLETIPYQTPYLSADALEIDRWYQRLKQQLSLHGASRTSTLIEPSVDSSIDSHIDAPNNRSDSQIHSSPITIGVVWCGNPNNYTDYKRSMTLTGLDPLFALRHVHCVSLQVGANTSADWIAHGLDPTRDWSSTLTHFGDTAAAIQVLDLVIAVDTSVAHLAGALNKPVWVLISKCCDWRWGLHGERTPWYPSMRLFRQQQIGDWSHPIGEVIEAIIANEEGSEAMTRVDR